MNDKELTKKSKKLSYVLRHKPEEIGLVLDDAGWGDVKFILAQIRMDMVELEFILANNDKKRFEFNSDKTMIRARHGHSVEVDLQYEPMIPPDVLYHGTSINVVDAILEQGISKQNRMHVHLSSDVEMARSVGSRHGKPYIFTVDSKEMVKDSIEFYKTESGVWLTDYVAPKYLIVGEFKVGLGVYNPRGLIK